MPDVFSPRHIAALQILFSRLESTGVWYRATGGLAGNIHGSAWPLQDIDIDYRKEEWELIASAFGEWLVEPPHQYHGPEFQLVMATATIESIRVEFCQLEDGFVAGPKGWVPLSADPSRREIRSFLGRNVWAQPLNDLIAYKEIIGRKADLADLRSLL